MKDKKERHMKMKMKTVLLLALLCGGFTLPIAQAKAIGLRENSIISDNTIKLGDVFYGLENDQDRVLGVAPAPGQEMVLNARTLLRIALAMDLPWRPTHSNETITLRRQATTITEDMIRESLREKFTQENVFGNYAINIPNEYKKITLPADQPATLEISNLSLDNDRKIYTAIVSAPSKDNPIQQFTIKGTIDPVIKMPVLLENVQNGRIITTHDITFIEINERDYSRDMIADIDVLQGMTARRMIPAGRPIRSSDLIAPQIVERGELVTLSLQSGILNLSTQAKALDNGAKGDIIRVVNTTSNQTLHALITGEKTVEIINN